MEQQPPKKLLDQVRDALMRALDLRNAQFARQR